MLEITSDPVPGLLSVTVCEDDVVPTGCGPKLRWLVLSVAPGTAWVPVPERVIATGSCLALLRMVMVPVSGPSSCGWNATPIWQVLPTNPALSRQAFPSTPKSVVSSTPTLLIETGA